MTKPPYKSSQSYYVQSHYCTIQDNSLATTHHHTETSNCMEEGGTYSDGFKPMPSKKGSNSLMGWVTQQADNRPPNAPLIFDSFQENVAIFYSYS